ncbi:hypothetical protein [Comamonas sp. 26]|uniref:hypothetical protein n=1 Tax=Comamonas sp. 26 TaxID=2035201 RepID=UPI000C18F011|nr:hypothetical protein [Comamonas sp. 26]PIG08298.1 hypothetical protein CLU84_1141 [Comamonas sp. 26]
MTKRRLLAIVSTDKENRIRCQHNECNHPVYSAIHVVLDDATLKVIGSTCFKEGYPDLKSKAKFTERFGETGRKLNPEELAQLINNTEQLVEKLSAEYEAHIAVEKIHLEDAERYKQELEQQCINAGHELREQRLRTDQISKQEAIRRWEEFNEKVAKRTAELALIAAKKITFAPLPASNWVNPKKSALALILKDGSAWVRCEDLNGRHRLYPVEPSNEWETMLPTRCAIADIASTSFVLKNVVDALFILRTRGVLFEHVYSCFKEAMSAVKNNKMLVDSDRRTS